MLYNCDFDLGFLFFAGIEPGTNTELEDVMLDFAEIVGTMISGTEPVDGRR